MTFVLRRKFVYSLDSLEKVVAAAVLQSLATKPIDSSKEFREEHSQLLLKGAVPDQTVMHGSGNLSSTSGLHLRTKEGENDVTVSSKIIAYESSGEKAIARASEDVSCAIYFDEKYVKNLEKFTSTGLSSNIFFRGALLLGKGKKRTAKEICQYGDHARGNKEPLNLNT
uniref:Uncharacterized protein n=1 Tax=Oryza barthii TaxID=65489 RepID=A0A0D3GG33_9ORYZ